MRKISVEPTPRQYTDRMTEPADWQLPLFDKLELEEDSADWSVRDPAQTYRDVKAFSFYSCSAKYCGDE